MKKYPAHNSLLPFYLSTQWKSYACKYNLCFSYSLKYKKQSHIVIEKLQELICLKPYLRQTFTLEKQVLSTCIHNKLPAGIFFHQITRKESTNLEKKLAGTPHNIEIDSSIKLHVIEYVDANECLILFNIHHILLDGKGLDKFIYDLNQLIAGKPVQYDCERIYIFNLEKEVFLKFDENNPDFADYKCRLDKGTHGYRYMPIDKNDKLLHGTRYLTKSITQKLLMRSKQYGISSFNLLLVAFSVFVLKIEQLNNIVVTYPVDIRTHNELHGCLLNTLAIPVCIELYSTYDNLLLYWKKQIPFMKRIALYQINHILSGKTHYNFSQSAFAKPEDLIIDNNYFSSKSYAQIANAKLSMKYREYKGRLFFSYDILTHNTSTTPSLLTHYFNCLSTLLDSPTRKIAEIIF